MLEVNRIELEGIQHFLICSIVLFFALNLDPVTQYFAHCFRLVFVMKKCNNEIVKQI